MLTLAIGHSEDPDEEGALEEVLSKCAEQLAGRTPTLGVLYAAYDFDAKVLLDGILNTYPDLKLVGCTTDGEMSSCGGFTEDAVVLTLFSSDSIQFSVAVARDLSLDSSLSIKKAVDELLGQSVEPPEVCLAMPDSLTVNPAKVIEELFSILPEKCTVAGAGAADQWTFDGTRQFFGREVLRDAMPIYSLHGPVVHSYGIGSGWKPIGKTAVVTKSSGNTIYTIDNEPAINYYRHNYGAEARPAGDRPLAFLNDDGSIRYLRASTEAFDEETGAIDYFGFVPEGFNVQLTVADNDAILDGAVLSIEMALNNYPVDESPQCALLFSCSARKLLLGTKTCCEKESMELKLGASVPLAGFYGYGEILNGDFHNETCVVMLLGEKS